MATNTERTVYIIELRDKFTKGMSRATAASNKFNKSTEKVKRNLDATKNSFLSLSNLMRGAAIGAAVAGLGRLAAKAVRITMEFQATRVAFGALVQDATKGNALFEWAKEFARANVVTFQQTTTSIRKLLAYGIGETQVRDVTKVLSEVSAAVGTDRLPYLTLALGQVYSAGRLYGTELRQFREHGVDVISELSKGLNMGTAKVRKQMEAGLITYDMVYNALKAMTEEGGRFHGFLAEAARTLKGAQGIMTSSIEILTENIFSQLVPTMTMATNKVIDMVIGLNKMDFNLVGNMAYTFTNLADNAATAVSGVKSVATEMGVLATASYKLGAEIADAFTGDNGWLSKISRFLVSMAVTAAGAPPVKTETIAGWLDSLREALFGKWINKLPDMGGPSDYPKPFEFAPPEWLIPKDQLDKEDEDGGKKKRITNRLVGTGARDIIINIGSLIENNNNYNSHFDQNVEALQEVLTKALLTTVNDVTYLAEGA